MDYSIALQRYNLLVHLQREGDGDACAEDIDEQKEAIAAIISNLKKEDFAILACNYYVMGFGLRSVCYKMGPAPETKQMLPLINLFKADGWTGGLRKG